MPRREPVDVAAPASRLRHEPALDGLRAVAVVGVLVFHGGFGWMSGGYLGVSVFFTLSGYLITRLLLDEHDDRGRIDLVGFASRRLRRLLPASIACLASVVVAAGAGVFDDVAGLRRDVVAAALHVANWGQLTEGQSYADLFRTGVSPVAHYWSLAIEEQFYLVWPLAVLALTRVLRGRPRRITMAFAGGWAIAAVTAWSIGRTWGADAVYLATPSRLAELLAGAALAAVVRRHPVGATFRWIGPVVFAIVVGLFVVTPSGHGWPYAGGLPVFALLSAALIAGLQVDGPLRAVVSSRPLVATGRISYGLYLYHWPIFVALDERLPNTDPSVRFLVACTATVSVAVVSFVVIEQPVRRMRSRGATFTGAVAATAALLLVVGSVTIGGSSRIVSIDDDRADAVAIRPPDSPTPTAAENSGPSSAVPGVPANDAADAIGATESSPAGASPTTTVASDPVRILVVGDSTSLALGEGLVYWAFDSIGAAQVSVMGLGGCGVVHEGLVGTVVDLAGRECRERMTVEIPDAIERLQPDVVVVSINVADNWGRSFDGGITFVRPTDPYFAELIRIGYLDFFARLVSAGAPTIVWLDPPPATVADRTGAPIADDVAAAGQQLIDAAVSDAVATWPDIATVLDLDSWLTASGILDDSANRPDGVHLSEDAALQVATEWLGPALVELVHSGR